MKKSVIALVLAFSVATVAYAAPKTKLTKSDAQAIALKQAPGKVKSGELEKEHGRWIYSFDIQTVTALHEVNVDANTGQVVGNSVESPAAEAKEKKADAAAKQFK
jgi:uncharacterized membrane protein YkoI